MVLVELTEDLIREMSWNKALNDIYDLAALHSWCTQVDQMIVEFITEYELNSEIIRFLSDKLKEENVPLEHHIVSLVLLNYLKCSTLNIIELANNCLYDKLTKNDLQFFKYHLFSGTFPLSESLTYDITNRSFLSAKRAIKKAMQIDSVISKENPLMTVLYMNLILCRLDMNEENRAMLAFLLLKIDVDLPESLKERVFGYLQDLKEIIKELLEEETTGIEQINKLEENIEKLDVDDKEQNGNKKENSIIKSIKREAVYKNHKIDQHVIEQEKHINKQKSNISILKAILNSGKENQKNIEESIIKIPFANAPAIEDSKLKVKTSDFTVNTQPDSKYISDLVTNSQDAKTINGSIPSLLKESKHKEEQENKPISVDLSKKSDSADKKDIDISKKAENKKNKSWQIILKRNRDILESILKGIGKSEKKTSYTNSKKTGKIIKKGLYKNEISGNRKNVHIYIGIIAILIIITSLFFILRRSYDNKIFVNQLISSSEAIPSEADKTSVVEDLKENNIDKSSTTLKLEVYSSQKLIPDNFPLNFTIVDDKIHWIVAEGESISGIFYILQELKPELKGTVLEDISSMEWEELYRAFVENNPVRESYHIIYASELFILPLK